MGYLVQPGTSRILTTQADSLPRPAELLSLIVAREAGQDVEMSKPSYATYVKDRLTGFTGEGRTPQR